MREYILVGCILVLLALGGCSQDQNPEQATDVEDPTQESVEDTTQTDTLAATIEEILPRTTTTDSVTKSIDKSKTEERDDEDREGSPIIVVQPDPPEEETDDEVHNMTDVPPVQENTTQPITPENSSETLPPDDQTPEEPAEPLIFFDKDGLDQLPKADDLSLSIALDKSIFDIKEPIQAQFDIENTAGDSQDIGLIVYFISEQGQIISRDNSGTIDTGTTTSGSVDFLPDHIDSIGKWNYLLVISDQDDNIQFAYDEFTVQDSTVSIAIDADNTIGEVKSHIGGLYVSIGYLDNQKQLMKDLKVNGVRFRAVDLGVDNYLNSQAYDWWREVGDTDFTFTVYTESSDIKSLLESGGTAYEDYLNALLDAFEQSGMNVEYYDIINEPDLEWEESNEELLDLFERTITTMKAHSYDIKLIGPTLNQLSAKIGDSDELFIDEFFELIETNAKSNPQFGIDAVALHTFTVYPETIPAQIEFVRDKMDEYGLCDNECPEIHMNEYSEPSFYINPGHQFGHIYYLEESNIDLALRSCWNEDGFEHLYPSQQCTTNLCAVGFNGLFTPTNRGDLDFDPKIATVPQPRPLYHLYANYAKMKDLPRLESTSSSPRTVALTAKEGDKLHILVGTYGGGQSKRWLGKNFNNCVSCHTKSDTWCAIHQDATGLKEFPGRPVDIDFTIEHFAPASSTVNMVIHYIPGDEVSKELHELQTEQRQITTDSDVLTFSLEEFQDVSVAYIELEIV